MACYAPVRSACLTSSIADCRLIHVVVCNVLFGRIMDIMKGVTSSWDSSGIAEEGNERHVTPQWQCSIQLFIIYIVFYLTMLSVAQNV